MTHQRQTVQIRQASGISVDLPPYVYPPNTWTAGRNVQMGEGFPRRANGYGRIAGTPLHVPKWLVNVRRNGTSSWVYGGDTGLAEVTAGVHTDIKGTLVFDNTGVANAWTGGVLNGRAILNPFKSLTPGYWLPATPAALPLPGWPANTGAGAMRVFRDFIIAMDITEDGVRDSEKLLWSDAAPPNNVPQSWTAGPNTQAGSTNASFRPGAIIDGLALRDAFYVYKTHSVYILQLIGGEFVMQARPLFATLGALTRNCVVEYRGSHIVLADGDVVIHNGVEAESLIERRVKKTIFTEIDPNTFATSFIALDKENSEVWVCVPEQGASYPTIAAVWSAKDNQWGVRDLTPQGVAHISEGIVQRDLQEPNWDDRSTSWNTDASDWNTTGFTPVTESLLMADQAQLLQGIDVREDFDGVEPVAELERSGLDFGSPDMVKYAERLWPKVDGLNSSLIEVRMGASMSADGTVVWDEWKPFRVGVDRWVRVNAVGRFLAVGLRSQTSAYWRTPAFDIDMKFRGRY